MVRCSGLLYEQAAAWMRNMSPSSQGRGAEQLDAMVTAARVFAGITAESIAQADAGLTLPQLRVLVLASQIQPLSPSDVAGALDVHLSTASRICDRLVRAGMLDRRDREDDRRLLALTLTAYGRRQLDDITAHRRQVFRRVLRRMEPGQRTALAQALIDFVEAAWEYDAPPSLP